jgi:glycosyltransferase involved in cell wall biosynthesis
VDQSELNHPFERKRILILVPGPNARGGITGYYRTLIKYFTLPIEYFERGSREWPNRNNFFSVLFRFVKDACRFYKKLSTKEYALVQTTTSFSSYSIIRDAIFILIAQRFKVKIIVFYHGWDMAFAKTIERKYLKLFKHIYFNTNAIIDLSCSNIEKIVAWGYTRPVFIETTVVDTELVQDISLDELQEKYSVKNRKLFLLFLARIEKAKGIYEAIDTYARLKEKYSFLQMIIAGDGKEELAAKEYVAKMNLTDIVFTGFVDGLNKKELFLKSQIYILPSYSEGMPTSVLEAMAFGIPVITRSVGGIPDFFINGENGFITNSKDPDIFADLIEKILLNRALMRKIAINNFNYAHNRFLSNIVVKRVEKIFSDIIKQS